MSNTREKTLSKMSLKVLIWGYWADNGDRYPKEIGQQGFQEGNVFHWCEVYTTKNIDTYELDFYA